jgi:hypothetical protein
MGQVRKSSVGATLPHVISMDFQSGDFTTRVSHVVNVIYTNLTTSYIIILIYFNRNATFINKNTLYLYLI